jgi:hypothetical protein
MTRVLVLHYTPRPGAVRLTTAQHLAAVTRIPEAEVLSYNAAHGVPRWLDRLTFDAVILHTTYLGLRWHRWFKEYRARSEWLAGMDALKVALPQDEYHHAHTLDDWLDDLGVSVVATVLDTNHRDELYPKLSGKAAFYEVLTGYVDDMAAERVRLPAPDQRPYDVVYRARQLPFWLGSQGQIKHRVGEAVLARAAAHDLRCDISTRPQTVVLGAAWLDLLASGRMTIGAESGSSTLDKRGELGTTLADWLEREPGLTFEEVDDRMPSGWDDYRFFAISPRHLEAVVTKTAQLLVEGRYSGVLDPERHYVPIRRDFSNLDEVLEQARDQERMAQLTERAYGEIYLSGRYNFRRLSEAIGEILAEHAGRSAGDRPGLTVARALAAAQAEVERVVIEPISNVLLVGGDLPGEMIAAAKLVLTERRLRRLVVDYARSLQVRENISPRVVLADLVCLAAISRSNTFDVTTSVDHTRHRILFTSVPQDGTTRTSPPELEQLLSTGAWEFLWDHSAIGREIEYRLAGKHTLTLELPAGPRPLPTLSWVAHTRPDHVAAALSPLLTRP